MDPHGISDDKSSHEDTLVNVHMSSSEIATALDEAASWIAQADAIVIGSGAGMSVDSGLGTFRGERAHIWEGARKEGYDYGEMCQTAWFEKDPRWAWGFWNFYYNAYQEARPHDGYTLVKSWITATPFGGFCFTSNIDSHWAASGWEEDRILEIHGALKWLQCSRPCCHDIWQAPSNLDLSEDPVSHRAIGKLPTCQKCCSVARPAVVMFGSDRTFSEERRVVQQEEYNAWLQTLLSRSDAADIRLVCVEIGCGLTVPCVREELEDLMDRFPSARLIRVNPESPGMTRALANRGTSLPLAAYEAIRGLTDKISHQDMAIIFLLGNKKFTGVEVKVLANAPLIDILQSAKRLPSVDEHARAELDQVREVPVTVLSGGLPRKQAPNQVFPQICSWISSLSTEMDSHGTSWPICAISLDDPVPQEILAEDVQQGIKVGVLGLASVDLPEFSELPEGSVGRQYIKWAQAVHDDLNSAFRSSSYRSQVESVTDRNIVAKAIMQLQGTILQKHGVKDQSVLHLRSNIARWLDAEVEESYHDAMQLSLINQTIAMPQTLAHQPSNSGAASAAADPANLKMAVDGLKNRPMPESIEQASVASQKIDGHKASGIPRQDVATKTMPHSMSEFAASRLPKKELASRLMKFRETSQEALDELSLDLLVSFLDELIQGFATRSFQRRLTDIDSQQKSGTVNKAAASKARLELRKTVHDKVLPRYGFEASLQGVSKMVSLVVEGQFRSQSSQQGRVALERGFEIAWLSGAGSFPQGWEPQRQLVHDDVLTAKDLATKS